MDWIKIKDRFPEIDQTILALLTVGNPKRSYSGRIGVWTWSKNDDINTDITHWMELPEPPKENEQ